mmetsp:Transcript_9148/g.10967  ORF Transcript_9148/g.10967 Transcript_9148/m.10967 type:complete len:350 (+) Transcript_9148:80-1129(+)
MNRENYGYLVWRLELGMVEVSVPPKASFFHIPAVVGKDSEGSYVYGEEALSRKEDLEIITISGIPPTAQRHKANAFKGLVNFVFRQPEVVQQLEDLDILMVYEFDYSRPRGLSSVYPIEGLDPTIDRRRVHCLRHSQLATYNFLELRMGSVCVHVESDFSILYRFEYPRQARYLDRIMIGFDHVVNCFVKLLCEKGYSLTSKEGQTICRELVKKYCYVAMDVDAEIERVESLGGVLHEVTLENGVEIELGTECFMAPEVIFNPGLIGMDMKENIVKVYAYHLRCSRGDSIACRFVGSFLSSLTGFKERLHQEAELYDQDLKGQDFRLLGVALNECVLGFSRTHLEGTPF